MSDDTNNPRVSTLPNGATIEPLPNASNVVPLPPRKEGGPTEPLLTVVERLTSYCFAHSFVFDKDKRTVRCKICNRNFEAFDAMVEVATMWRTYQQNYRTCTQDIERLKKEHEKLSRDVKNLKAQKRRLVKTNPEATATLGRTANDPREVR